jgi:hypothetical protein
MNPKFLVFALTLVLAGCASSVAVPFTYAPKKLHIGIGGPFGPAFSVTFESGGLTYRRGDYERVDRKTTVEARDHAGAVLVWRVWEGRVIPTDEQWKEFWDTLDALRVWQWQPDYSNHDILDGTSWGIEIEYADRAVKSGGANGYPDADGKPGDKEGRKTKTFQAFSEAIKKLVGGRDFY